MTLQKVRLFQRIILDQTISREEMCKIRPAGDTLYNPLKFLAQINALKVLTR